MCNVNSIYKDLEAGRPAKWKGITPQMEKSTITVHVTSQARDNILNWHGYAFEESRRNDDRQDGCFAMFHAANVISYHIEEL